MQSMVLQSIVGGYCVRLPDHYYGATLFWVEYHTPFLFPCSQAVEVMLQNVTIVLVLMRLYRMQSSAKSLMLNWTQSGRSCMNIMYMYVCVCFFFVFFLFFHIIFYYISNLIILFVCLLFYFIYF